MASCALLYLVGLLELLHTFGVRIDSAKPALQQFVRTKVQGNAALLAQHHARQLLAQLAQ